jgi:hypothetical protein
MFKVESNEYRTFVFEMMDKENFPIDNFNLELYLGTSVRTKAYAGFVLAIETPEGDAIVKTSLLSGDPYSFGNRRAVKRAIKAAKKIV